MARRAFGGLKIADEGIATAQVGGTKVNDMTAVAKIFSAPDAIRMIPTIVAKANGQEIVHTAPAFMPKTPGVTSVPIDGSKAPGLDKLAL